MTRGHLTDPASPTGVSVVIPHHGDPTPTLAPWPTCAAVAARPLEVVVVDDCSPGPSRHRGRHRRAARANGGFGSAVNTGAAVATQPLLLVLNSDVSLTPTFVDDLVAAAEPWMPAVVGPLRPGHRTGTACEQRTALPHRRHQSVEWLTPLARFRDRRVLHEAVGHDTRAAPAPVLPVDWVVGAAHAAARPRRSARSAASTRRYFMNSEEIDLQRRLRDARHPHRLRSAPCRSPTSAAGRPTRRRGAGGSSTSRLRYADTWGGRRRLQASLTAATAVNAVVNTGRRLAGRDVDPLATAREELRLIHGGRS